MAVTIGYIYIYIYIYIYGPAFIVHFVLKGGSKSHYSEDWVPFLSELGAENLVAGPSTYLA